MNINFQSLFIFHFFFLICIPAFLSAQTGGDGNHCAVRKSPFRLSMDSGKVVYVKQCLSCHQADGLGISNINPPLNGKVISGDKKTLIEIIITGRTEYVEVSEKKYKNTMPPNPAIKDQEIADVLTYIRNSFGNKASTIKVSEVKSERSKLK
jgi:mono/diheme cytochrome c family protein